MEVNHDARIVVMNRDMFDRLMQFAFKGESHSGEYEVDPRDGTTPILKHIHRFNSDIARENREHAEARLQGYRNRRKLVRDLVKAHQGKVVYVADLVGAGWAPMFVVGPGRRSKDLIRVRGYHPSMRRIRTNALRPYDYEIDPQRIKLHVAENMMEMMVHIDRHLNPPNKKGSK